jgi:hypothetical protein
LLIEAKKQALEHLLARKKEQEKGKQVEGKQIEGNYII